MNDWGIPDWQDSAAYGDTEVWSLKRWHWEFLRRRDDLRREFELNAPVEYESRLVDAKQEPWRFPKGVLTPTDPGFYILTTSIRVNAWEPLPNPKISNQPESVLPSHETGFMPVLDGECLIVDAKEPVLRFDLRQPIPEQIAQAKQYLVEQQEAKIGKKIQFRMHPAKWLNYLRILDARDAQCSEAPWEKIAEVLSGDSQFDYSWVVKAHRAAVGLSFEFNF